MPEGFDFTYYKKGTSGADKMTGGSGNDRLDGLTGNDTMIGGKGNDSYVARDHSDKVIEKPNEGYDTLYAFRTCYVPEHVEKVFLVGVNWKTEVQNGYGNNQNNYIGGNCGSNRITGGNGNDSINGGGYGNDTLEGGAGNDWVQVSRRACQAFGNSGNDSMVSWYGNDILCGGAGGDLYKGFYKTTEVQEHGNFIGFDQDVIRDYMDYQKMATGMSVNDWDQIDLTLFSKNEIKFSTSDVDKDGKIDRLHIDAGKYGTIDVDKYFSDTSSNVSASQAGIGCIEDIRLAGNVHMHYDDIQVALGGTGGGGGNTGNIIKGTNANNTINITNGASQVYGYAGNDRISSGTGNDTLCGGKGNDVYNGYTKAWGHDVIRDYMDYGQTAQVSGSETDWLDLTKFSKSNLKFSKVDTDNDGKADRLHIDAGNYGTIDVDKYFSDTASTALASKAGTGCIERIVLANDTYMRFADIQQTIAGGGGGDTGNIIKGTSANNTINITNGSSQAYGYAGNDTIYSGTGSDTLCGGKGSDLYRGYTQSWGHDVIRDYMDYGQTAQVSSSETDKLDLTKFSKSNLKFSAVDTDNDRLIDRLHIDAGNYGTIDIDKYFSDTSSNASASKAGTGCIEDLILANNSHLHFSDVQHLV